MKFKILCQLTFESDCIKNARNRFEELQFLLKELNHAELSILETDRLFYDGEIIERGR